VQNYHAGKISRLHKANMAYLLGGLPRKKKGTATQTQRQPAAAAQHIGSSCRRVLTVFTNYPFAAHNRPPWLIKKHFGNCLPLDRPSAL
jgi:hypothetical protein